jgi:hypothetical protein
MEEAWCQEVWRDLHRAHWSPEAFEQVRTAAAGLHPPLKGRLASTRVDRGLSAARMSVAAMEGLPWLTCIASADPPVSQDEKEARSRGGTWQAFYRRVLAKLPPLLHNVWPLASEGLD